MPITQDLERDGGHSFHYMAGSVELAESADLEGYYGLAPHLCFLESFWPGATDQQLYEAVRDAPSGLTPEEKMRYIERRLPRSEPHLLQGVLLDIRRRFVEEGPFDCILGYSEGALVAATFLIDILKKAAKGNSVIPPRCAVFMNGATPYDVDGKGRFLADKCGQVITIPTCHILAYNDTMAFSSVTLYHLCNEELASMVDHGRGHSIPRDARSSKRIAAAIQDLVERTEDAANVKDAKPEESQ